MTAFAGASEGALPHSMTIPAWLSLAGRTALVTGGGTGIGRAAGLALARLGASVALMARASLAEAESAAEEARRCGAPRAVALRGDVRLAGDCERVAGEAAALLGAPVDILVNNAGTTRDALLARMSEADWDEVQQINLRGVFLMSRALLPAMIAGGHGGKIVNVTSVIGLVGNGGQANYAAAKAALGGLTRTLSREVAEHGIQVNAVAPGFIETRLTRALTVERRAALLASIPARRFGAPDDVSGAIAFLCTAAADYITGQTLVVDGGMLA